MLKKHKNIKLNTLDFLETMKQILKNMLHYFHMHNYDVCSSLKSSIRLNCVNWKLKG